MYKAALERLFSEGLLREVADRASAQGRTVAMQGRELLNFASNNYLGLCSHPRLLRAAKEAGEKYGFGAGASRLLGGGSTPHGALEQAAARLKAAPSALLFSSGYSANTGAIPALAPEGSAIFSDQLNHASIIDGIRLSKAQKHIYRHRDMQHLRELLGACDVEQKIVITDTVFSMDGDLAPLPKLYTLCQEFGAMLYLDDAHGTGVLGKGRGGLAHFNLSPEQWVVQMATFSKALGSFGAFIAAEPDIVQWLINSGRSFIFSTALPTPVVAASLAAIEVMQEEPELIDTLESNRLLLLQGLKSMGLDTGQSETPIVPIILDDVQAAVTLSARLLDAGIYAPAIRPPTVKQPRIRLTVTAAHTKDDIKVLLGALEQALADLG